MTPPTMGPTDLDEDFVEAPEVPRELSLAVPFDEDPDGVGTELPEGNKVS